MTNTRRTLAALALAGAALTATGTAHAADPGDKSDQTSSTTGSTSENNLLRRTTNALSPLTSLLPVNVNDLGH
ncbi:hypothetical protein [Streptomyces purpurascens]|uniref:hypothetical protein n=1 Tax=Streptomyces purpurascens TaxID=1924 RepID=UPI00167204E9|nr:hypothetical protein [Streptomyces purpurascens]MCE7048821.1 hypothetical protein [Streptomyces purpurascens]GGZ99509.1 hypothetical protein GCM10010303_05530 [Streptomyces purpurascens]